MSGKAHYNTLNIFLRATFDIETALKYKAQAFKSRKVIQDDTYSLVLRVLRNGGFLFIRTQEDVDWIRTSSNPPEQQNHLDWILANSHYGFRTGTELILLTEAGMEMISFDRNFSFVTRAGVLLIPLVRQLLQTLGLLSLSNELDEGATDDMLLVMLREK